MKNVKGQIISGSLFFIIFFIIFKLSKRSMKSEEDSISKNKIESICQVYRFYSNRSFDRYYYKFYFDGKEYYDSQNIYGEGEEKCVGKYYKIYFSSQNMKFTKIFLQNEIKDLIKIRNAGFKLN